MATINLTPDADIESNGWTLSSGSDVHPLLADSDDTTGAYATAVDKYCIVTLSDLGALITASATIDSIRWYLRGSYTIVRSGDTDLQVRIGDGTLTSSGGTSYFDETFTLTFNAGYAPQDYYGTARTTSDGSTPWTTAQVNAFRLDINTTPEAPDVPGGNVQRANIWKAYIEVTYTLPTDDAIFFGTNF